MKLYDVPRRTWVRVVDPDEKNRQGPPDAPNFSENDVIFFDHVDGMYSFCKTKDGQIVHLKAWAEVEIVHR